MYKKINFDNWIIVFDVMAAKMKKSLNSDVDCQIRFVCSWLLLVFSRLVRKEQWFVCFFFWLFQRRKNCCFKLSLWTFSESICFSNQDVLLQCYKMRQNNLQQVPLGIVWFIYVHADVLLVKKCLLSGKINFNFGRASM